MNPRLPKSVLLPLAAGLVQILSGCLGSNPSDPDKSAGGSDEIDTRIAVDRTGRPVPAARIALVRTDDSTGKPVAVNATGTDGSFPNFVVPDGFYSVVLRDPGDSLGKYVDSVQVKNQKVPAGRDTLLALGSIRGVVRVSAGHSPVTVSMGLVGTDILATVKADGTFRIELVPGGIYTLGAFPMLDGYGPLYLRLQLKDGQNLMLPDTLVMPFTGLPSPGALRVLQDTGTGNVRVSWSRVDHPDLLGYVLERVEGGTVTLSGYLTDTTWTDSLDATWEAMPLYGPWPSREVAYRVRSRSLSGLPDSKSVAQAITAKPPEWTKRMDSVKVVLAMNPDSEASKLSWNFPDHPDIKDWTIIRKVNGVVDCQDTIESSEWTDNRCPEAKIRVVSTNTISGDLLDGSPAKLEYSLLCNRKSGRKEYVNVGGVRYTKRSSKSPKVDWRDSGESVVSEDYALVSIGRWIGVFKKGQWRVSSDAQHWIDIPNLPEFGKPSNAIKPKVVCQNDSIWLYSVIDSQHVKIGYLNRDNSWSWKVYSFDFPMYQTRVTGYKGGILIGDYRYGWLLVNGMMERIDNSYFGSFASADFDIFQLPNGCDYMYGRILWFTNIYPSQMMRCSDSSEVFRKAGWGDNVMIGAFSTGGILFNDFIESAGLGIQMLDGQSWVLETPGKFKLYSMQSAKNKAAVLHEEIWAILDGHLWKGKLNLPK